MSETVPKEELLAMVDHELPASSWIEVDQDRIDRFAEATEDHQFIHVDPGRRNRIGSWLPARRCSRSKDKTSRHSSLPC